MDIYVDDADLPVLLEISRSPDDCFLNHRVAKAQLKRLLALELIEVETRRCSIWFFEPNRSQLQFNDRDEQRRFWEAWGAKRKARFWQDRTEIHARLTDTGREWMSEYDKDRAFYEA